MKEYAPLKNEAKFPSYSESLTLTFINIVAKTLKKTQALLPRV